LARKTRVFIENIPVHVLLRSLNSMVIFNDDEDKSYFLSVLKKILSQSEVDIHSYCVFENFFEFLATPKTIDAIPKLMQSLGRQYAFYYNKKYNRSGTIWDGRYKSSLVEASKYLFDVMFFIETREKFFCNSYNKNFEDKKDEIITYHELYKQLGYTQKDRLENYKALFEKYNKEKKEFIETCIEKQTLTATKEFIKNLEKQLGTVLLAKKKGRPKKEKGNKGKKMYKNLQILDKEKHKDLKISPIRDLFFAKDIASLPIMLNEASEVARSFPIVFTNDENTPQIISLLSLGNGNLAINSEGKWITKYIPISLRKYPFSMASVKDKPEQKIILLDEDSPLVSKAEGENLFSEDGTQTELLENAIKFLSDNEKYTFMTKQLVEQIVKSGILEDREISVGEGEEKKVLVSGFKVVSKEKLNALSDDILASWVRTGIITFIDIHLKSLDNINILFDLANQRQG
jgi:putative transposase